MRHRARTLHIPVARVDNRRDKTSFLRAAPASWRREEIDVLHVELRQAFGTLARGRTA